MTEIEIDHPTVILAACSEYDVDRIRDIAGHGLDRLGLSPFGQTLVKPNCVTSGEKFPHAYTRPEFLEGVLGALGERAQPSTTMRLGERCGITIPTRYAFKEAGYYPMLERAGVEPVHFDEVGQVEIPLTHDGRLRDSLYVPRPVAEADFFVNCPKFKAHPWTTVTFSMKNYIGIQDDRHRLIDHDHKLNNKVADLQYVLQPRFIAIDAIIAGEGRMLTPLPFDLGLVIMGNNQVAFDAVCCHIIGLDPLSVDHIRLAHERGFGPVDLDEITIDGDVTLSEAKTRAEGFRVGLIRVEEYFADSSITAHAGPPPAGEGVDEEYCWGGCPGAMEEAIEIMRLFDDNTDDKLPTTHIVFGDYDGEIDAGPDDKVVFIGDCATYEGEIGGSPVTIDNLYIDRSRKDPLEAEGTDIFAKMASVERSWFRTRNDQVLEIRGCPVSVAEQVLLLVKLGKLKSPYLDPSQIGPFVSCYLSARTQKALRGLRREPYNTPGPAKRGSAAVT
jgi:uncharacterized protein (DUF362 family)